MKLSFNSKICVFSKGLFLYLEQKIKIRNHYLDLIEFPNVNEFKILKKKKIKNSAIIYGNSNLTYFDIKKFIRIEKSYSFSKIFIDEKLKKYFTNYRNKKILFKKFEDGLILGEILSSVEYSILCFTEKYDYYSKKKNASGIILTNNKFNIKNIIDFNLSIQNYDLKKGDINFSKNNIQLINKNIKLKYIDSILYNNY